MEYWSVGVLRSESITPALHYSRTPFQFCLFVIALVNCNHLSSAFSYSALVMPRSGYSRLNG